MSLPCPVLHSTSSYSNFPWSTLGTSNWPFATPLWPPDMEGSIRDSDQNFHMEVISLLGWFSNCVRVSTSRPCSKSRVLSFQSQEVSAGGFPGWWQLEAQVSALDHPLCDCGSGWHQRFGTNSSHTVALLKHFFWFRKHQFCWEHLGASALGGWHVGTVQTQYCFYLFWFGSGAQL